MISIGLHGVEKTVLLNEIEKLADKENFENIFLEAERGAADSGDLETDLPNLFIVVSLWRIFKKQRRW